MSGGEGGPATTVVSPDGQPGASIPARLSRLLSHGVASHATIPIVLDPVLVSSSGGVLLDARGRAALLEKLLPQATLVTPNVPEIAALLRRARGHRRGRVGRIRRGDYWSSVAMRSWSRAAMRPAKRPSTCW